MKRRIGWLAFAVVTLALLIPVSISAYGDWQVYSKGSLCVVRVVSVPRLGSGSIKFVVKGVTYDKKVSGDWSRYLGKGIQLKHLDTVGGHYLFPDENPMPWDIAGIGMTLFCAIAFIYYAVKKDPPPIR